MGRRAQPEPQTDPELRELARAVSRAAGLGDELPEAAEEEEAAHADAADVPAAVQ